MMPQVIRNDPRSIQRLCKAVISLALATFALIVGYDNLVDFGANQAFVQHVLSMDSIFPDSALKSRAFHAPWLWQVMYVSIILAELLVGGLLLTGGLRMLRALGNADAFLAAKNWIYVGGTAGFLLWFVGFMVIGGEWFAMWQSSQWNGIDSAFRFIAIILGVMIYVAQPEQA